MKSKEFIHAGDLRHFGTDLIGGQVTYNAKFSFCLPWPIHNCNQKKLSLEECKFVGEIDNKLHQQEISIETYFGQHTVQLKPLALLEVVKVVADLNMALEGHGISFSSIGNKITINMTHDIASVKLSHGLASILGLPVYCIRNGQNGIADLGKIYSKMLLLCSQVKPCTLVQNNNLPVIAILKHKIFERSKCRLDLYLSLGALDLNLNQLSTLNLELISSAVPNVSIPFTGSGFALFSLTEQT